MYLISVTDIETGPKLTATLFNYSPCELWTRAYSPGKEKISAPIAGESTVISGVRPETRSATSKEFHVDVEKRPLFDGT